MAKMKSLGRGLGELLGEIEEVYDNEVPKNAQVVEVPLTQIRPNPFQPRKHFDEKALSELAASIKTHGLIQPIVVVENVDGYVLVAGERRWRASKLAKLKHIRAVIASIDESQMRQHALVENIQREELNVVELARAYEELIELHGLTQEELSSVVHKSRSHITNTLRLLQLSKKTLNALVDEKISAGHAKILVGLTDKEQKVMVDSIYGQKLSVRETERMVKNKKKATASEELHSNKLVKSLDLDALCDALKKSGFSVSASGNKIAVTFKDGEDVAHFLDMIQ